MSHRIANMLAAFCEDSHNLVHITKHTDFVHNNVYSANGKVIGNKTHDVEWMRKLAESRMNWKVISGDMDIIDTAYERAALIEPRLTLFVCDHTWARIKAPEQAWKIVKLWDEIVRYAEAPNPSLYRFHSGRRQYIEVIRSGMRARGGKFKG
jgi:hypothetical protein